MEKRPAIFIDRDGVINPMIYHRDHGIVDSPFTMEQFTILPEAPPAIRLLNNLGFVVVIASNQPGIAKGHFQPPLLDDIGRQLTLTLAAEGAHIDAVYYCLHHPDAVVPELQEHCSCRKPNPGLLVKAAEELGLSLASSYMVGDGLTDIEAGHRAGCKTVFIGRWKPELSEFIEPPNLRPDFVAKNLWQAAQIIERDWQSSGAHQLEAPQVIPQ